MESLGLDEKSKSKFLMEEWRKMRKAEAEEKRAKREAAEEEKRLQAEREAAAKGGCKPSGRLRRKKRGPSERQKKGGLNVKQKKEKPP